MNIWKLRTREEKRREEKRRREERRGEEKRRREERRGEVLRIHEFSVVFLWVVEWRVEEMWKPCNKLKNEKWRKGYQLQHQLDL
jgi:hypothetical protein